MRVCVISNCNRIVFRGVSKCVRNCLTVARELCNYNVIAVLSISLQLQEGCIFRVLTTSLQLQESCTSLYECGIPCIPHVSKCVRNCLTVARELCNYESTISLQMVLHVLQLQESCNQLSK